MMKELFCHLGDDYKVADVVKRREVYSVKDEDIEIEVEVSICCKCGEELFDKELDEVNIERAVKVGRGYNSSLRNGSYPPPAPNTSYNYCYEFHSILVIPVSKLLMYCDKI